MNSFKSSRGFTLIELMITVAVIAILTALAYPAYTEHVRRTHRTTAAGCLSEIAQHFERQYTTNMAYGSAIPTVACIADTADSYTFATESAATTSTTFAITATPVGAQAQDTKCGTLRLNEQGIKGAKGSTPDTDPALVKQCWR